MTPYHESDYHNAMWWAFMLAADSVDEAEYAGAETREEVALHRRAAMDVADRIQRMADRYGKKARHDEDRRQRAGDPTEGTVMKYRVVMVLCWCARSEQNQWSELWHKCRTMNGLRKQLKAGLKAGHWIEWRILDVIEEGKL